MRFSAIGAPRGTGYCHCQTCRHHTGAPVVAFVAFSKGQVEWVEGKCERYESLPGKLRAFCRDCGASMTFVDDEFAEFHIGTLDRSQDFPPDSYMYCDDKISWLSLSDNLPRYSRSIE